MEFYISLVAVVIVATYFLTQGRREDAWDRMRRRHRRRQVEREQNPRPKPPVNPDLQFEDNPADKHQN
jgi:hypothetical protein